MAKRNRLTPKSIAELTEPGKYFDGDGLYLQVSEWRTRSWLFRYTLHGGAHWMGLGALHTFTLKEARQRARQARQQLADGIDPIETRRAARQAEQLEAARAITFKEAAESYIAIHKAGWTNQKHAGQWTSSLATYAYPHFGHLPVAAIDTGLILQAIEPIWQSKTETASRVRGRIESILDWAAVRGYRSGENPARWKGHLQNALPAKNKIAKVKHFQAMPYTDLPGFMADLRNIDGMTARALEITILCATRTGETIHAKWDEIDTAENVWTIPAERTKANREQRIPLCDRALSILCHLPNEGELIFPGAHFNKPINHMAMLKLLRAQRGGGLTIHGMRAAFRQWCAEQTNFSRELAEAALGHVLKDKTESAYQRSDLLERRRRMMSAWDAYLARPIGSGEVVSLRKGDTA